jgi:uncharacterized protein YjbI with pentapeptide repeats
MRLFILFLFANQAATSLHAFRYQKTDGTWVDPVRKRSAAVGGQILHCFLCPDLEPGVDRDDWDLDYVVLPYVDLRNANLRRARLQFATLEDVDLTGADLTNADLTGARLYNADLTNVNLSGSDLSSVWDFQFDYT